MSKHTPGPWSAFVHRSSKTIAVDIGPDPHGKRPCIVAWTGFDGCDLPLNQRIANARLIAAAPDMHEALHSCVMVMERDLAGVCLIQPELEKARAALAKAEGA